MANGIRNGYRVGVRPDPNDRSRYLWTIHGIRNMFWEQSPTAYTSVEQALAEANARADQLD
ncbi:hypothetical protein [Methylobacterium sp. CM6257]